MTIVEDFTQDDEEKDCLKCRALVAIFDQHPWLLDPSSYVTSGPKSHATWCRRRAQYEAYKAETTMPVDKKFAEEVVKAHNEYRSRHQAPSIKHAKDLSEYAQKWADHLVATGSFQHSSCEHKGDRLGENIAMKWSSRPDDYSGQEVTDQWYSEVKMHTFGTEPKSLSSGHFTQVVWKGSSEVGVGRATGKDGKTIVVASYRPAGNMVGKFSENVLPPKDGKIILPVKKDTPSSGSQPFSSRFEDARRGFPADVAGATGGAGGGTETKTTRTHTVTEGSGANAVTKTIVEETIIKADGSKVTRTRETVTSGGSSGGSSGFRDDDIGKMSISDDRESQGGDKDKKKSKHRSSSPSSSDSSPESSKRKTKGDKDKKPQKIKDFIDESVKVHNELRAKHGADKLKHAKDLSDYAQKWAEHLAATDSFQHSDCMHKGEKIGENICCKWSSDGADYTGREACEQWYSEISKHDFNSEPRSLGSGHFTQVVWKGSKEMGIGKAKTSGGKVIVVANYRPAGNFVGKFMENVAPLKK